MSQKWTLNTCRVRACCVLNVAEFDQKPEDTPSEIWESDKMATGELTNLPTRQPGNHTSYRHRRVYVSYTWYKPKHLWLWVNRILADRRYVNATADCRLSVVGYYSSIFALRNTLVPGYLVFAIQNSTIAVWPLNSFTQRVPYIHTYGCCTLQSTVHPTEATAINTNTWYQVWTCVHFATSIVTGMYEYVPGTWYRHQTAVATLIVGRARFLM